MNYLLTYFLLLVSTLLYAQSDTIAEHYKGVYNTAIFPASYFSKTSSAPMSQIKSSKKLFTPTHADADRAEKEMRNKKAWGADFKYFARIYNKLSNYNMQFFGLIDFAGHRLLYINCFCGSTNKGDEFAEWLGREIFVCDGGDCFWNVCFDLDTGKFIDLSINGEA